MTTYFQAKVELNGKTYEGACYSGEDFAVRSLIQEVAADLKIAFTDAVALLQNRVAVVAV